MTAGGRDGSAGGHSVFGLSRRRLLAGLGGIGAIGAASGAGTSAYFTDAASFADNGIGAGEVEILIDGTPAPDGTLAFEVDSIDRGESGTERFRIEVRTNRARLWLGTDCPPAFDPLGDAIQATLSARIGSSETTLASGSLADIRRALVSGIRLDDLDGDACLDPAGDPLELVLDWSLPADAPERATGASTPFGVQLYTEQCRHVSEATAENSNPFADAQTCPDPCVICADGNGVKIGSLRLRYLGAETAHVTAAATGGGAGGAGQGGTVVFDGSVDPDETFLVDAGSTDVAGPDGNWIGPNLYVDDEGTASGGNGTPGHAGGSTRVRGVKIHTSCSEPLEPGMVFGNFEIVSATTIDGMDLCDARDDDENGEDGSEEPEEPTDDCVVCADGRVSLRTLTLAYIGPGSTRTSVQSAKGNTSGVLFDDELDTGEEFTIDGADVDRPGQGSDRLGPDIRIEDAAGTTDVHVSCSEPLQVGDTFPTEDPRYEIIAGTTTDGRPLCGSEEQ